MSLPRKSTLCQSAELNIIIIIIFTSSAHYTRDPRRTLFNQLLTTVLANRHNRVLRGRKPACSSSDSHGKSVPKKEDGVVHSGKSQDGVGNVHTLGNLLLDTTVTPAPCTACGYLNYPQDRHKKCSLMATDNALRE